MRIILVGGDSPGTVPFIRVLKKRKDVELIGIGFGEDSYLRYGVDEYHVSSQDHLITDLIDLSRSKNTNVVFPLLLKRMELISKNLDLLRSNGLRVVHFGKNVDLADDKFKLLRLYERLGYDPGNYSLLESSKDLHEFAERVGFPSRWFVVKPLRSRRSVGVEVIRDRSDLKRAEDSIESGLVLLGMEYFPGEEYTVDVYRSPIDGKVVAVPKRIDRMLCGITFSGEVVENHELMRRSVRLASELEGEYCFSFQFRVKEDGDYGLLECNPRLEGAMIMSVLAGADMLGWCVDEAAGKAVDLSSVKIKWGMRFKLVLDGIGFSNGMVKTVWGE